MSTTVSSLAALVGGRVVGDGDREIRGIADLRDAAPDRIGFVKDPAFREIAQQTRAGAILTTEELDSTASQIVVRDAYVAYARVALHFHPQPVAREHRVHPTAVVDPEARLVEPVEIGPGAVVGKAVIGRGTTVMAGAVVGDGCELGEECVLYPRVVLYPHSRLGNRVVLHAGAVIGADGFGYARDGAEFVKIPQRGGVRIDDDVELGANVTVDRGAIQDTVIGARTKIDNMCHIGHNVRIGQDCVFAGGCFLAGSTVLGDRVILAGHNVVAGHRTIASDVRVGGNSGIALDITEPGDYMGYPPIEKKQFLRSLNIQRKLPQLAREVEALRRRLDELERGGAASA